MLLFTFFHQSAEREHQGVEWGVFLLVNGAVREIKGRGSFRIRVGSASLTILSGS